MAFVAYEKVKPTCIKSLYSFAATITNTSDEPAARNFKMPFRNEATCLCYLKP